MEQLKAALDDSSANNRHLLVGFWAVQLYTLAVTLVTSDEDLLLNRTLLRLPLTDLGLPPPAWFCLMPLLLFLLHLGLLHNLHQHLHKLLAWRKANGDHVDGRRLRPFFFDFAFAYRRSGWLGRRLDGCVWLLVCLLPLSTLLAVQIRFGAYQHLPLSGLHLLLVLADAWACARFYRAWVRAVAFPSSGRRRRRVMGRLSALLQWLLVLPAFVGLWLLACGRWDGGLWPGFLPPSAIGADAYAIALALAAALLLASRRIGYGVLVLAAVASAALTGWFGSAWSVDTAKNFVERVDDAYLAHWLPRLVVRNRILLHPVEDSEQRVLEWLAENQTAQLAAANPAEQATEAAQRRRQRELAQRWWEQGARPDWHGRTFNLADLSGSLMARADLRDASLQGADLRETLLPGAQLQGAQLSQARLERADLRESAMHGADLRGTQLQGTSLVAAQLEQADLREALLQGADLREAQLTEANAQGAHLEGALLSGAQMPSANFTAANLRRADLSQAQMQNALFNEAQLEEADFSGAQMQGTSFVAAQMEKAVLGGAQMQGANFLVAQMRRLDLGGAQLQGADFDGAQLQDADLDGAHMQGANFIAAQMQGADLGGARLQGAHLQRAHMQGANLGQAQLQGADIDAAQLQGANLAGTQLQGANLAAVQLQGAYLGGAQLQGAILDGAQLQGSYCGKSLYQTQPAEKLSPQRINKPTDLAACPATSFSELSPAQIQAVLAQIPPEPVGLELRAAVAKRLESPANLQAAVCGVLTAEMADAILAHWNEAVPEAIIQQWAEQGQACPVRQARRPAAPTAPAAEGATNENP